MSVEVTAGDHTYTVVEDLVTRFEVIFVGSVLDEISGASVSGSFTVTVDREDLVCRTVSGGRFCVAADIRAVFPDLTVPCPPIRLSVQAAGYREKSIAISFPANPIFPVTLAALAMRRLPVRLQGRVNQNTVTHPPIPGARIIATAPGVQMALVRAPVHFDHAMGITVQPRTLNALVLPPARRLAAPLSAGETRLLINNRQNLIVGQILQIGSQSSGQYSRISTISPTPADLTQPGEIALEVAPNRSFPRDTPVDVFDLGIVGPGAHLVRSADGGDGLIQLDGPLAAATIEIVDPAHPTEYHALGALTDGNGYYACDGICGVPALDMKAVAAGFVTPLGPVTRILDYNQPTNIVDFRL